MSPVAVYFEQGRSHELGCGPGLARLVPQGQDEELALDPLAAYARCPYFNGLLQRLGPGIGAGRAPRIHGLPVGVPGGQAAGIEQAAADHTAAIRVILRRWPGPGPGRIP